MRYTAAEFADKVEYEGGVGEMLLHSGALLPSYDLSEEFKEKWARLHALYIEVGDEIDAMAEEG